MTIVCTLSAAARGIRMVPARCIPNSPTAWHVQVPLAVLGALAGKVLDLSGSPSAMVLVVSYTVQFALTFYVIGVLATFYRNARREEAARAVWARLQAEGFRLFANGATREPERLAEGLAEPFQVRGLRNVEVVVIRPGEAGGLAPLGLAPDRSFSWRLPKSRRGRLVCRPVELDGRLEAVLLVAWHGGPARLPDAHFENAAALVENRLRAARADVPALLAGQFRPSGPGA